MCIITLNVSNKIAYLAHYCERLKSNFKLKITTGISFYTGDFSQFDKYRCNIIES